MAYVFEKERKTPIVRDVDVLVCGGGFGGIAAALAAARQGKKVLLCEREFSLGGLGTLGLVTIYLPLCNGLGKQVSFGIAEELLRLSIARYTDEHRKPRPTPWLNGEKGEKPMRYLAHYNPWYFAIDAEELLRREGVEILYGTAISDVLTEDGKIKTAMIENIDGRSAISVKSVVDATGSAVVAKMAGEDTRLFSMGNVPSSWYYYLTRGELKLQMFGPADYRGAKLDPSLEGLRFSGMDATENTKMLMYARQQMMKNIAEMGKKNDDPGLIPVMIAGIQQLRMTQCIVGAEEFKAASVGQYCKDSVGCFGNWKQADEGYELPFGSLYGKKIKNLITAGRCTCSDDEGWDLTRVIPVCAVSGEAAGIAASMTDDFASLPVEELQAKLKEKGVLIHLNDPQ